MTSDTSKLKSTLETLSNSLDNLEAQLEPLLSHTLPEVVADLETIQQAKLQTVLPYLVYDLIFIYLKSRGIEPKSHGVVSELDRVRQYFEKIQNAEDTNQRRTEIDKAASVRFIKHAIAQSTYGRPPGEHIEEGSNVRVPVKVTGKMLERAEYEKELKALGSEEEEDLNVFGDVEDAETAEEDVMSKGKGKSRDERRDTAVPAPHEQAGGKRRRPTMDPFAGYGGDTGQSKPVASDDSTSIKKTKITSAVDDLIMADIAEGNSGRSTPVSAADSITSKKSSKAAKKAKRKAKTTSSLL